MIKFLKWFFGLFSSYVNPFERRVDRFFKHIKSTDGIAGIKEDLLELMQKNLLVLNVWLEKKYKGYSYLKKSTRRKLYENSGKIVVKFQEFCAENKPTATQLKLLLDKAGLSFLSIDEQKLLYLLQIMLFFSPGKHYHYVKSSSFGRLLADIDQEKMEGDCNQIVTLYIYFYSLKFPVQDLNIKLLPEHVCLRFKNVDIEATNATFQNYKDDQQVLPITEIISTNLLDINDDTREAVEISPRDLVKSAQLAYAISSHRAIVEKNLKIAYQNLGVAAMNAGNFDSAIFYLEKCGDQNLIRMANHNAAIQYMKQNNFDKALFYAEKAGDNELESAVRKNSYLHRYNELVKKVSYVKTLEQAKKYKSTYNEMLSLAQKLGDSTLVKSVQDTLSKI